jgi:PAS domain S-box-containing protein
MNHLHRIARYPGIHMAISSLLVLLVMSAAAWQGNRQIEADREMPLVKALGTYAATLEGGTVDSRAMGAAILFGLENQEAKQLALGKLPPDAPGVLSALDTLRTLYLADAAFLVNRQGVVAAYSSKDDTRGTGRNLPFLPYVQLAMQGTPNVYPAVGGDDMARGIYLAAPLRAAMDNTSGAIGAVVVKVGADKLDALLQSWTDGTAVLLSPQGVVFAAGREDWLFRMTGEMSAGQIADIQRTGQFGKVFDQAQPAPLPFTLDTPETSIDGVRYAVRSSQPLEWNDPAGDWKLAFLEQRAPWWTHWRVLGFAGFAGLITALALSWLYTQARNAVLRQESYRELESAQQRLRISEARLHAILDNSPIGIWLVGVDGRYHFVNKTFCNAVGIPESEFLATRHLADIMDPEVAAGCLRSDRECLEQDEPHLSHEMLTSVDGKQHLVEITKVKLHDDTGRVTGIIGISTDITERRQADLARQEALDRLQKIASQVPGVVYQFRLRPDGSSCVPYASEAVREIYRFGAEEVRADASKVFADVHPDDLDNFKASIQASARDLSPWQQEYRLKFDDGTVRWLFGNALPQREADGSILWHGFITDITERKQVDEALRESKEKAESATRIKSEFIANMSHEIRTPMNSILGMAHLALYKETNPKTRGYLEKIQLSGMHLLEIIDEILDFSKIDARKLKMETVDFDLGGILKNLNSLITVKATEKGLQLDFDIDPGIPNNLRGDPRRLSQVLINYASNAIKFTATGNIVVRAKKIEENENGTLVRFEVQDTGIGISGEDQAKLFQPFQQVDASITRDYGGTGLGLAISKQLVEMMAEGKVGVDSIPGRGSTFWFTVRLGQGSKPHKLGNENETDIPFAMLGVINGARILLAENNLFNQQVATEFLDNAGATVCVAQNGKEAIDLLLKEHFDCVLMDIQMPLLDGFEATRLIRDNPALAGTPVIAMTANASEEDRARCLAAGMDDYISKPFRPNALYATLAKWLSAQPQQEPFSGRPSTLSVATTWAGAPNIIDLSVLSELIGDSKSEMRKFILKFMALTRKDMAEIESALKRKDLVALSALGHHNKSPARMVGAIGFANLCQALEDIGGNGGDVEQARDIVNQMRLLLDRISEQIDKELA